jgi:hypothetical protein
MFSIRWRTPLTWMRPLATPASSSGASRRRNVRSAISSVFQITAVAFSTFLYRFAAAVRKRTAAKGDSIGFEVPPWETTEKGLYVSYALTRRS